MRIIVLALVILAVVPGQAQSHRRLVLWSHDITDGPMGGVHHVSDIRVFADGYVAFSDEGSWANVFEEGQQKGNPKTWKSSYRFKIGRAAVKQLEEILDSPEIRPLPPKVPMRERPTDFLWQKSIEIREPGRHQRIEIEDFYPFANEYWPAYPDSLIELECSLQNIEITARKGDKKDGDWCRSILSGNSGALAGKNSTPKAECVANRAPFKVVAGEGWGPLRVGATLGEINGFLGVGEPGSNYSDSFFRKYSSRGLEVSFDLPANTVHAMYFYNHQHDSPEYKVFCGQTDKGVDWASSIEDVKEAYGAPTDSFSGGDADGSWVRLVFQVIDFRFENGRLVRIGIRGK